MNRIIRKYLSLILIVTMWVVIAAYVIWALKIGNAGARELIVGELRVEVTNHKKINIVTPDIVKGWITAERLDPVGVKVRETDIAAINREVSRHPFVASSKCYVDYTGTVTVSLSQRCPIMRIKDQGVDFYLSDDGWVLPTGTHTAHYVPIVTGSFPLPFEHGFSGDLDKYIDENKKNNDKSYLFLSKLINFVNYIEADWFWQSQIVQINVVGRGGREAEIELVPRIGDQLILLGSLDNYKAKLDKLMAFYRYPNPEDGWQTKKVINLKFDNQIVCTK